MVLFSKFYSVLSDQLTVPNFVTLPTLFLYPAIIMDSSLKLLDSKI